MLQYSLKNARLNPQGWAVWEEEDYCNPPLGSVLEWQLDAEQLKRLDEASAIDLGFPHGFLDGIKYIFGETFDMIDNHHK